MKKIFTIAFLLIKIFSVVVHNLVHHQHQGDKICVEMDFSDYKDCTQEHSESHYEKENSDNEKNGCNTNCTLNEKLLAKIDNNQDDFINSAELLPICEILFNYISFIPLKETKTTLIPCYITLYKSQYYNNGQSLRAHPKA